MGELGRAGGQAGMGRKMGREGKGGLEEETTVKKGGIALCEGAMEQRGALLYFTLNISGLRSDFPHLHTEIPCLLRQFLAFAVTFLSCTVNSLTCSSQ